GGARQHRQVRAGDGRQDQRDERRRPCDRRDRGRRRRRRRSRPRDGTARPRRPGRGARRQPRGRESGWGGDEDRGRDTLEPMTQLPRGRVTLLFTDIEGSTALVQTLGPEYPIALGRHRDLLRDAVEGRQGIVLDTLGDETSNVFSDAALAVA